MKITTINSNQIGETIAEARRASGLSQVTLAKMMGVNKRTISAYEKGTRRVHGARLIELAKSLNISLDSLTGQKSSKFDGRTRYAHALRELENLPHEEQKLILGMIDTLSKKTAKAS